VVHDYELVALERLGANPIYSLKPGLTFVSPLSKLHRFDSQTKTLRIDERMGHQRLPGIDCQSLDPVYMACVVRLEYQLDNEQADKFIHTFGWGDEFTVRPHVEEAIRSQIAEAVRRLVPQYYVSYLLTRRNDLEDNVMCYVGYKRDWKPGGESMVDVEGSRRQPKVIPPVDLRQSKEGQLATVGVKIIQLTIDLQLPDEYQAGVSNQLVVLQRREIAARESEAIQAEKKVASERIELRRLEDTARIDSEITRAQRLAAEPYSVMTLFFDKWDGRLPSTVVGDPANLLGALGIEVSRLRSPQGATTETKVNDPKAEHN